MGQPGLVIEPLSLVRNPPQAAGGKERRHHPPGVPLWGRAREAGWGALRRRRGLASGLFRTEGRGTGWEEYLRSLRS